MSEQVKAKVELNKVTHSVRAAQAVLQYGVGAMVDFPDQTLVTAAPEYWSGTSRIYDDRFASSWGGLLCFTHQHCVRTFSRMVFLSEVSKISAVKKLGV